MIIYQHAPKLIQKKNLAPLWKYDIIFIFIKEIATEPLRFLSYIVWNNRFARKRDVKS